MFLLMIINVPVYYNRFNVLLKVIKELNNSDTLPCRTKNIFMKKIIIAIAFLFGSVGLLHAQTHTTVTKKEKKEKTTTVQSKGLKKGKPTTKPVLVLINL